MTHKATALALLLSLLLTGCAAVLPQATSTPMTPIVRLRTDSPAYGFEAYLWWKPEIATRDLGLVRSAGFTWVKQTFAWRDIEVDKGKFDWSHADETVFLTEHFGLKLLARLDRDPWWDRAYPEGRGSTNGPPKDLRNFANYCAAIATRYKGRIAAYQIWNEPNLAREWGGNPPDPKQYVEMLRQCYLSIKAVDPIALVISAGLSPTGDGLPNAIPNVEYLEGMYKAGAQPYFDLLGVNAPGFRASPETSPEETASTPSLGGQRFFA
ncbi:MAG TPA: beta-galactosidase, partial [Anaerolineae bacterium]